MNKTYLDKQMKIKEDNLKYDFLPSMLEIIERPENKVSNIIIWLVLALIVSAVVWAAFAKTDIAITAQGSIMPKGNLISVSSPYGGEIKEI
ncbi:MAG: multidrug transporter, partial [Lachnospiraceae bacterium]|nr:multidrug transporter [Lachnospiraceae bacterium]